MQNITHTITGLDWQIEDLRGYPLNPSITVKDAIISILNSTKVATIAQASILRSAANKLNKSSSEATLDAEEYNLLTFVIRQAVLPVPIKWAVHNCVHTVEPSNGTD